MRASSDRPSYRPTHWRPVNRALDLADVLSHGHADWIQRLVSFLFVGGFAALVNLTVFFVMYEVLPLPFDVAGVWQHALHYATAFAVATEVAIFANFIPNDHLTFRHLPGHQRSWLARAGRFHLTSMGGTAITLAISATLHFFSVPAILAQAIALAVTTAFNFTFHHLFTYRHVDTPASVTRVPVLVRYGPPQDSTDRASSGY